MNRADRESAARALHGIETLTRAELDRIAPTEVESILRAVVDSLGGALSHPIPSPACDLVLAMEHPDWEDGGPCHECAFRQGTVPSQSAHTTALARLSVEGTRPFHCHVHPGLCRGFVAALNLRGEAHNEAAGMAADILGDGIDRAAKAQIE